jgi:hemoglobin
VPDDDAPGDPGSIYEQVGGWPVFRRLVDEFYARVATDEVLRPLYPDELTESKEHLSLFLAMYFGGPQEYLERRGHPRLRARHFPFAIGKAERDAWVKSMLAALDAAAISEPSRTKMIDYFEAAATFMINREE